MGEDMQKSLGYLRLHVKQLLDSVALKVMWIQMVELEQLYSSTKLKVSGQQNSKTFLWN